MPVVYWQQAKWYLNCMNNHATRTKVLSRCLKGEREKLVSRSDIATNNNSNIDVISCIIDPLY